jgi:hypothetical protein
MVDGSTAMYFPMRRGASLPMTVLALALVAWIVTGSSAFAKGGGGGGGHGGGGHSGSHGGGYHGGGGGYHGGGDHQGGGYNNGYYPGFYSGFYGNLGYGYGSGYTYPYDSYGTTDPNDSYPAYGYGNSAIVATPATAGVPFVYRGPAQGRYLGIDEQAVTDSAGTGMKVMRVYQGSAAQQAGLEPGDVILSANGYVTQQHGHLAWIITTVPPSDELRLTVHKASNSAIRAVNVNLP